MLELLASCHSARHRKCPIGVSHHSSHTKCGFLEIGTEFDVPLGAQHLSRACLLRGYLLLGFKVFPRRYPSLAASGALGLRIDS